MIKVPCTRDNPITQERLQTVKGEGEKVVVAHDDVAYSEVRDGLFCINCGWGPLGKPQPVEAEKATVGE